MLARYEKARKLIHGRVDKSIAFNTTLYPHWIGGSDCFWYRRELDHDGNHQYRLVDAGAQTNSNAFDHAVLADALQKATGEAVNAKKLSLVNLEIDLNPRRISFTAFERFWVYDDEKNKLEEQNHTPDNWKPSPDGRFVVFDKDHNLWLQDLESGEAQALTTDGHTHYVYGGTATAYGRDEMKTLEVIWSPDSQRLFAVIKDNEQVKPGPPLVEHVSSDGSVRPRIVEADRRVALPGDDQIECYRMIAIDIESGAIMPADYPPCPVFAPIYVGFFTGKRGWWSSDSRRAYFIDFLRGGNTGRLIEFDTQTGQTRIVIEETSDYRFCFIPDTHLGALLVPLPETQELIWYTERSGSAHLYLYDLKTGEEKNAITSGDYVVRGVLHVDAKRREVWIQTGDRKEGRHPVYADICRVNIDTGTLIEIVSTDHEYVVTDGLSRVSLLDRQSVGVSASGNYVVSTRSRVDEAPVSVLFDREGRALLVVEEADVSGLPEGWTWPEQALVTAADGKTILDAVLWFPSDFEPEKSYPVIDASWGGAPPPPVGSFSNNPASSRMYLEPAAMAELGFVVVQVNQRGAAVGAGDTGGVRDVAYSNAHEFWNCISPNMVDVVGGIKELGRTRPYMDLDRVGIGLYPSSAVPMGGMLRFPDFYKVGVTCNAYLDLRLAGEFYSYTGQPLPEGALDNHPFHDMVSSLKGKLLMMHGMMNPCTPVAATFGFVEALHKANKDFDMLVLPSLGHGTNDYHDYTIRRRWDYFVTHLLGETPPKEFDLAGEG